MTKPFQDVPLKTAKRTAELPYWVKWTAIDINGLYCGYLYRPVPVRGGTWRLPECYTGKRCVIAKVGKPVHWASTLRQIT